MRLSLFILLFFFVSIAYTQNNDLKSWSSISFEKKINKKFSVENNYEFRSENYFNFLDNSLLEVGLNYDLNKKQKFKLIYRRTWEYFNNKYIYGNHRLSMSHKYIFKLNKQFKIKHNLKAQYKFGNLEYSNPNRFQIRNKLEVNRKINKWFEINPFVEIFQSKIKSINKYRFGCDLEFEILNKNKVSPFYFYQKSNQNSHTIGLIYSIKF